MNYMDVILKRRSIYGLSPEIPITDDKLIEILSSVIDNVPSPFNCQNPRIMLLLSENHKKLWSIVMETLKNKINDEKKFIPTKEKIEGFSAGYGTIVYFSEKKAVEKLETDFPSYKHHFSRWADQANGIILFGIWSALAEQNIGANIQHYNPLIDDEVKKTFSVPESWELIGQMPFGKIVAPPTDKQNTPLKERFIIKK